MEDFLGPILKGNEIKKAITKRSTPYIFKTVTAKNSKILKEKVKLEEKDGWEFSRKNKKSIKMQKLKPLDEQFEDLVWVIVARMGFKELSDGRNFKVKVGHGKERQIDVFAKDDESAVFIECTQSEKPKKINMSSLIEKILSIQKDAYKSVRNHYGDKLNLKMKWIIATKNIRWGEADLLKAENNKIIVLSEPQIQYYINLTDQIRIAAKYQFLAHVFANEEVRGIDIKVAAIRGKMGGTTFYNFLLKPLDLMKISYVSHQASQDPTSTNTYQRMLKTSKLRKIASYIDAGGSFPTNIVLNFKSNKGIKFDNIEKIGHSSFGTLYLPNRYASAWVIDGQHRLYGYAFSDRGSGKMGDTSTLPILAFEKLPTTDEIDMFIDINHEQTSVPKNLLYELVMDQKWESENVDDRLVALRSKVAMLLEVEVTSPLHNRVIITGKKKSAVRCLTFTSLVDGLKTSKLLGEVSNKYIIPGPISNSNPENMKASLKRASEILSQYFGSFQKNLSEHWGLGSATGGYLCTNNGVRALLIVLKEICDYIEKKDQIRCSDLNATDLIEEIDKCVKPLIEYFKSAPSIEIKGIRDQAGGLAGVKRQANFMMARILEKNSNFGTLELKEFVVNVDSEETHEARDALTIIETKVYSYVIAKLKNKYGGQWWQTGVPDEVQKKCYNRMVDEHHIRNVEQYLDFIDIRKILFMSEDNWNLFQKEISFGEKINNKKKVTDWLAKLNTIRNIVCHPPKGNISTDQANYVKEIAPKINLFFS